MVVWCDVVWEKGVDEWEGEGGIEVQLFLIIMNINPLNFLMMRLGWEWLLLWWIMVPEIKATITKIGLRWGCASMGTWKKVGKLLWEGVGLGWVVRAYVHAGTCVL